MNTTPATSGNLCGYEGPTSKSFAFTLSPPIRLKPLLQFKNPNRVRFDLDAADIRAILARSRMHRHIIYPEFDNKGRLHYHGIIDMTIHDYVSWHKSTKHRFERTIGFTDLKELTTFQDKLKWNIYIRKSWPLTHKILQLEVDDPPIMKMKDLTARYDQRRHVKKKQIINNAGFDYGVQSVWPDFFN